VSPALALANISLIFLVRNDAYVLLSTQLIEKYMDSPDECLNAAGLDANPPSPVIASSSLPNPSHIHAASSFKEPARKSKRTAGRSSLSSAPTSSHSSSTNLLKSTLSKTSSAAPSPETFECPICCLEFDGEKIEQETLALACSHRACRDCWGTYLEGKIKAEGESVRIQCLEDGCGRVVSEKVVEGLVGDGVRERFVSCLLDLRVRCELMAIVLSPIGIMNCSIELTSTTTLLSDGVPIPNVSYYVLVFILASLTDNLVCPSYRRLRRRVQASSRSSAQHHHPDRHLQVRERVLFWVRLAFPHCSYFGSAHLTLTNRSL
jgi:hypothetical protein